MKLLSFVKFLWIIIFNVQILIWPKELFLMLIVRLINLIIDNLIVLIENLYALIKVLLRVIFDLDGVVLVIELLEGLIQSDHSLLDILPIFFLIFFCVQNGRDRTVVLAWVSRIVADWSLRAHLEDSWLHVVQVFILELVCCRHGFHINFFDTIKYHLAWIDIILSFIVIIDHVQFVQIWNQIRRRLDFLNATLDNLTQWLALDSTRIRFWKLQLLAHIKLTFIEFAHFLLSLLQCLIRLVYILTEISRILFDCYFMNAVVSHLSVILRSLDRIKELVLRVLETEVEVLWFVDILLMAEFAQGQLELLLSFQISLWSTIGAEIWRNWSHLLRMIWHILLLQVVHEPALVQGFMTLWQLLDWIVRSLALHRIYLFPYFPFLMLFQLAVVVLDQFLDHIQICLAHVAEVQIKVFQRISVVPPGSLLEHLNNALLELEAKRVVHRHAQIFDFRISVNQLCQQFKSSQVIQLRVSKVYDPQTQLFVVVDDFAERVNAKIVYWDPAQVEFHDVGLREMLEEIVDWLMRCLESLNREDYYLLVFLQKVRNFSHRDICEVDIAIEIQTLDLEFWIIELAEVQNDLIDGLNEKSQLNVSHTSIHHTQQLILLIEIDWIQNPLWNQQSSFVFSLHSSIRLMFDEIVLDQNLHRIFTIFLGLKMLIEVLKMYLLLLIIAILRI